jgi:hypothetical protein
MVLDELQSDDWGDGCLNDEVIDQFYKYTQEEPVRGWYPRSYTTVTRDRREIIAAGWGQHLDYYPMRSQNADSRSWHSQLYTI